MKQRWLLVAVAVLLGVVLFAPVARLAGDLTSGELSARLFDEDAYYTFTVARNVADGNGVTIDGEHATTGFQPLWTFATVPFFAFLSDGAALAAVAVASFALWLVGAWSFGRLVARVAPAALDRRVAIVVAATVFLGAVATRALYLNGLETGLLLTLVLIAIDRHVLVPGEPTRSADVGFGLLLAMVTLGRFDGIVVAIALTLMRVVVRQPADNRRTLVIPLGLAGAALVPWLVLNVIVAGTPSPQSGVATSVRGLVTPSLGFRLGEGVDNLAAYGWWPVAPTTLDRWQLVALGAVGPAVAAAIVLVRRGWPHGRNLVAGAIAVGTTVAVAGAYVVVSAATWYYYRYFALCLVALLALLAAGAVVGLAGLVERPTRRRGGGAVGWIVLAALAVGVATLPSSDDRIPRRGYMSDFAARLVALDIPSSCGPIGMFESGRTSFALPDRVVNLDGKVNVDALDAVVDRRLGEYLEEAGIGVLYGYGFTYELVDAREPGWDEGFERVVDPAVGRAAFAYREAACPELDELVAAASPVAVGPSSDTIEPDAGVRSGSDSDG